MNIDKRARQDKFLEREANLLGSTGFSAEMETLVSKSRLAEAFISGLPRPLQLSHLSHNSYYLEGN